MSQLQLQEVGPALAEGLLEVEQRHDVWVGLADNEVVAVEHLTQQEGGQVQFQAAVAPAAGNVARHVGHSEPGVGDGLN